MKNFLRCVIIISASLLSSCIWKTPFIHAAPVNDNFASSQQLSGMSGTISATNIGATAEAGEPNHGDGELVAHSSIWFRWTAPADGIFIFNTYESDFDTTMALYSGVSVDSLEKHAEDDDVESILQSRTALRAAEGTAYSIAVDGFFSEQGNVKLAWYPADYVPNDDFAMAAGIEGTSGLERGTNLSATAQAGEPNHGYGGSTKAFSSVWYTWEAPAGGPVIFNTYDSDFDTVLAAYQGAEIDSLTLIEKNDDINARPGFFKSRIAFDAAAGISYHIAVDGFNTWEEGDITLRWQQLPPLENDSFYDATEFSGRYHSLITTNFGATTETGEPAHTDHGGAAESSIWFRWKAPFTGPVILDTYGSDFDTVLAVYTGGELDNLVLLAENDDSGSLIQSRLKFHAAAGTNYHIAVAACSGYDTSEQGLVVLSLKKTSPWPVFLPAILNSSSKR